MFTNVKRYLIFYIFTSLTAIIAVGSIGGTVSCNSSTSSNNYTISGTITGLTSEIILRNTSATISFGYELLTVSGDATSFQFVDDISPSVDYSVTVDRQPTGQHCTITNGSGTISNSNVTDITIDCIAATTVTGVNPSSGDTSGGTVVYITGANFTDASSVTFGDTDATSYTVVSDSAITAIAPAGTEGTVDVYVTSPIGTNVESEGDVFAYGTRTVFIASADEHAIYNCSVSSTDGTFSDCTNATPSATTNPAYLSTITIENSQYLYFTEASNSDTVASIYGCTLESDPTSLSCLGAGPSYYPATFAGLLAYTIRDVKSVYYSESDDIYVRRQSLDIDGTYLDILSSFTSNDEYPDWTPESITIQTVGGVQYAYITASEASVYYVWQCDINEDTGEMSSCTNSSVGTHPTSVTFTTVNDVLYAYVGQSGSTGVYLCSVDTTTGAIDSCAVTPSASYEGPPFSSPEHVSFQTIDDTQYIYVTDATDQKVYKCGINSDGNIAAYSCAATPASDPSESYNPSEIIFAYP